MTAPAPGSSPPCLLQGYDVPLVADIHFQPKIAMDVAEAFEKIRINPGNFVDGRKTFDEYVYDSKVGRRCALSRAPSLFHKLESTIVNRQRTMKRVERNIGDSFAMLMASAFFNCSENSIDVDISRFSGPWNGFSPVIRPVYTWRRAEELFWHVFANSAFVLRAEPNFLHGLGPFLFASVLRGRRGSCASRCGTASRRAGRVRQRSHPHRGELQAARTQVQGAGQGHAHRH